MVPVLFGHSDDCVEARQCVQECEWFFHGVEKDGQSVQS